jgi:membrane fusion protein (multidrug efflux system)
METHLPRYASLSSTLVVSLVITLAACGDKKDASAPPPPLVETITLKAEPVPNFVELPGRIEAVRTAEVRARSDGIIQRRLFEEGSYVTAGTPLFQIDPRDYRAQVQSSQAALERAIATRQNAASIVQRYDPLIRERAVSAQEYDKARSDLRQAEAQVSEGRAALARSQLLLEYTTIRAPISGRVGRAEVTEGALVTGSQGTLMTRIDQRTPVYAVFSQSNASILDTIDQAKKGALSLPSLARVGVQILLENGATYGQN